MTVGRCGDTANIVLNRTRTRLIPRSEFLTFFSAFFLSLLILIASLFAPPAKAQDAKPGVVGFGDLVVTGASGTLPPPANPPLPPGVNQLDETFINPDGASLKVFDVRNPGGPAQAQLLNAPTKYQALARDIGQVFGLALDKSNPPNIFAASTPVHGLQIVVPDACKSWCRTPMAMGALNASSSASPAHSGWIASSAWRAAAAPAPCGRSTARPVKLPSSPIS
jgi:hypothetical protein